MVAEEMRSTELADRSMVLRLTVGCVDGTLNGAQSEMFPPGESREMKLIMGAFAHAGKEQLDVLCAFQNERPKLRRISWELSLVKAAGGGVDIAGPA